MNTRGAVHTQHSNNRSAATPQGVKSQDKPKYDLEELKRKVGITPFTERIDLDEDGFCACPFHNGDSKRSFHVVEKDGAVLGTCFSDCGDSWDAIDFVKQFDTVGTGEAIRKIAAANSDGKGRVLSTKKAAVPMTPEKWAICGMTAVNDTDVAKLAASRPHSATPSTAALNALGFRIASRGGGTWIVAPYRLGGSFYTLKARNLTSKEFFQENAVSQQGLFNIDAVKPGCDVYIVESELDAAVLHEHGYIAVSVVNSKQHSLEVEVLKKLNTAYRIFLVGDNDTAGIQCMDAFAELLPPEKVYRMPLTDVKDVGEWAAVIKKNEPLGGDFKENWDALRSDALASWVKSNIPTINTIPDVPQIWTIDRLLPEGGYLLLAGNFGCQKSLLGLLMSAGIDSGSDVLGRKTIQHPILYIDRENPKAVIAERKRGLGIPVKNNIHYWGDWAEDIPELDDPRLLEFAVREKGVIIFDSYCDWLNGESENDTAAMAEMAKKFRRLARLGSGVVVLHHTSRADDTRSKGNAMIPAGADMSLIVIKAENGVTQLRPEKFRSCAAWHMDLRIEYHNPIKKAGDIHVTVLKDELVDESRRKQKVDTLQKAKTALSKYHHANESEGANKTCFEELLMAEGLSRKDARSLITQGTGKHWSVKNEPPNTVRYFLNDWVPDQEAA